MNSISTTARIRTSMLAATITVVPPWSYAVPLAALDGDSLAQYLKRHHAGDPRPSPGV